MAWIKTLRKDQVLVVNGVRVAWLPGRKLAILDQAELSAVDFPPTQPPQQKSPAPD